MHKRPSCEHRVMLDRKWWPELSRTVATCAACRTTLVVPDANGLDADGDADQQDDPRDRAIDQLDTAMALARLWKQSGHTRQHFGNVDHAPTMGMDCQTYTRNPAAIPSGI